LWRQQRVAPIPDVAIQQAGTPELSSSDSADLGEDAESVTISVGNVTNTLVVTQAPRPPLTLAPSTLEFPEKGDRLRVLIKNVPTNAIPQVESANVAFSGGTPVRAPGKDDEWEMLVSAHANLTPTDRSWKMTISAGDESETLTLTQKGTTPNLTLNPDRLEFDEKGSSKTVAISASLRNLSSKASDAFLVVKLGNPSYNKEDGKFHWTVTVTARENRIPNECKGTVTFTAGNETKTLNITQKGKPKQ